MDQNPLKTSEPIVGLIDRNNALYSGNGRMIFISKSAPFDKDGKKVCKVTRMVSTSRQKEKAMCMKLGMNRKQFKRWLKKNRHKEIETKA